MQARNQLQSSNLYFTLTLNSHFFCLNCADKAGLVSNELHRRSGCPACGSPLPTPEDALVINLKPTEEYRTTILSGLPPSMIMECAGRAMNFWVYQTIQHRHYQEHLFKSLSEQHKALKARLQQTEHNAQVEAEELKRKLHGKALILALKWFILT